MVGRQAAGLMLLDSADRITGTGTVLEGSDGPDAPTGRLPSTIHGPHSPGRGGDRVGVRGCPRGELR